MDARYKIAEAMMRGVGQPMAAFPDQRQDADMSLRGMASDLYQADQKRAQDYRANKSSIGASKTRSTSTDPAQPHRGRFGCGLGNP